MSSFQIELTPSLDASVGVLLNIAALTSYAIYTVLLRRDADRADAPDALVPGCAQLQSVM